MRLAVVGGGIAGCMLALRLLQRRPRPVVELFAPGPLFDKDATAASGGLVRAFEKNMSACELAAASMTELLGDAWLREAGAYREIGSAYVLPADVDCAPQLELVNSRLPGSARLLSTAEVRHEIGLADLPVGCSAVLERHAGYLSPAALRSAVLDRAAGLGAIVTDASVTRLTHGPRVTMADGSTRSFDAVVVATGAWTPALLGTVSLRTRQIQYGVYPVAPPAPGCFVDDVSGLYGRPFATGWSLLGMATARWDAHPRDAAVDGVLAERVGVTARRVFGLPEPLPRPMRLVAAVDCFASEGGLMLRTVPGMTGIFTFTGGAGSAAKTVVAASRKAADALVYGTPCASESLSHSQDRRPRAAGV